MFINYFLYYNNNIYYYYFQNLFENYKFYLLLIFQLILNANCSFYKKVFELKKNFFFFERTLSKYFSENLKNRKEIFFNITPLCLAV